MRPSVYSKYVYLFELDSVRTSLDEVQAGIKALYTETVLNKNIVVLSFNQVADSLPFISMLTDEKSYADLYRLFEIGSLRISQFRDTRTVIQYLINKIDPLLDSSSSREDRFLFSAMPVKSSQKRLLALIRRCLINSDLSELHEYITYKHTESELRELFTEVFRASDIELDGDNYSILDGNVLIPVDAAVKTEQLNELLKSQYRIILHLLQLSSIDNIYIPPRKASEYQQFSMFYFLKLACSNLFVEEGTDYEQATVFIKNLPAYQEESSNRSYYHRQLEEMETSKNLINIYRYVEAIINNCYNYAIEYSIANVSKHYNQISEDSDSSKPDLVTFKADFMNRLRKDLPLVRCYLEKDNSTAEGYQSFKFIPILSFPRIDHLETRQNWVTYTERLKYVPRYEYKVNTSFSHLKNKRTFDTRHRMIKTVISLFLFFLVNLFLNDVTSRLFGTAANTIRSFIETILSLIITEILTVLISHFLPAYVSSLSEIVSDFVRYFRNERYNKQFETTSYRIPDKNGKYAEEKLNATSIPINTTRAIKRYLHYWKDNPTYFRNENGNSYPLFDITSAEHQKELYRQEELTGKRYGLLYRSEYNTLIVDPVLSKTDEVFAYERIIPCRVNDAQLYAGVVMIPVYEDKYILIKQFRHALREEQLCFPRGFSESADVVEDGRRELSEEINAGIDSIQMIGICTPDSGLTSSKVAVCVAHISSYHIEEDNEGIIDCIAVTKQELETLIKENQITDGFTLSAWCLYLAIH